MCAIGRAPEPRPPTLAAPIPSRNPPGTEAITGIPYHTPETAAVCRSALALLRHFHSSLCRTMIWRHLGHRSRTRAASWASRARRTAGKVGRGGGPVVLIFLPLATMPEPEMLQDSEGDQRHRRLAQPAGVLPGNPDRVLALLGQRGGV